ncbi:MAG: hypothetical protein HYY09_06855 [Firmicutes bacterium]|nr:hypothetical protein [Bacillota bacterium]
MRVQQAWSGWAASGMFLEGLCGGMILAGVLAGSPVAVFAGTMAGILAALALLVELDNPRKIIYLLARWRTAWLSRGALMLVLAIASGLLYSFSPVASLLWPAGLGIFVPIQAAAGLSAGIAGVSLILYPAFLLASFRSIPFWRKRASVLASFGTSLISGLGGFLLVLSLYFPGGWPGVDRLAGLATLSAIVLQTGFIVGQVYTGARGTAAEQLSTTILIGSPLFPFGVILVQLAVPFLLVIAGLSLFAVPSSTQALFLLAGGALLAGSWAARRVTLEAGVYGEDPPLI